MKIVIVGGAGFIGSNLVAELARSGGHEVVVFDNFSSGRRGHLAGFVNNSEVRVVEGEASNLVQLREAMKGCSLLFHLASNPDIAKASTDPTIDFTQGTLLSQQVFEAARIENVANIVYASGSGVFGDDANREFDEESFSPRPTSTYAASKIAGEAMLSSYCAMFGMNATTFRFANVVGPNQTHGVAFDFIKRLRKNPIALDVLGNGTQSKSYIHVEDIVAALLLFGKKPMRGYNYYNLCTGDYIDVRTIARVVISKMRLSNVEVRFGQTAKGWVGDVPIIRFSSERARSAGWKNKWNSLQAIERSVEGMLANFADNRIS